MTFRTRYGGEKERVSKELLGAIAAAQSLKDKIKLNQTITGETIGGFACLGGCNSFDGEVAEASTHRPWCAWNYYIKCTHCGYEGNLAKYALNENGYLSASQCECQRA
ncbi:hypothetical protein A3C73_02750 [Candidatus Giovannonibacteria bacterium RIFCSPHIGHO2_02_FULL_44_11]|nr:MAG: hypothetical protein A3C73_02750 [Candidatus Giovannonibacteria bacterium RIFCSPHIGHO2_02_FULL_44_11]